MVLFIELSVVLYWLKYIEYKASHLCIVSNMIVQIMQMLLRRTIPSWLHEEVVEQHHIVD